MPDRGRLASRISVVIPVLNAARTLPLLFESIDRLAPAPLEVLLVDNGSTDDGPTLMRSYAEGRVARRVRLLEEKKRGAASARNTGIRAAKGEIVAFTDSDCSPDPAWLENVMLSFDDSSVGAVAGRVVGASGTTLLELFSSLYTLRLPDQPSRHGEWTPRSGGFPTANFSVRRALADKLGGFDENVVIYGEDYDFCARIYDVGASVVYRPEALVVHHHRASLGGMTKQAFGFGRGHAYVFRRHGAGLWIDLPGRGLNWRRSPVRAWLDFAAADKKLLSILIAAIVYTPLLGLLPIYAVYLILSTHRRAREAEKATPIWKSAQLACLLLVKSTALTLGRWWGSATYRTLCF